jgi:DNA-binding NarL/FixJ family response regulator
VPPDGIGAPAGRSTPSSATHKKVEPRLDEWLAATAVIDVLALPYGRRLISWGFGRTVTSGDARRRKMASRGTILVVDHDDATRTAAVWVVARLGYLARVAENAESVLARLDEEPPVLAIVEVELTGPTSGFELLHDLHAAYDEELPVILVSAERTAPLDHVAGLLLGADDYLSKPFDEGELLARVRRSLRRATKSSTTGKEYGGNAEVSLSPRELEILALLSRGLGQLEIAQHLVVSPKTVGTHIQHILSKLGVHSRAQAVAEAYRLHLVGADFAASALLTEPI